MTYEQFVLMVCIALGNSIIVVLIWEVVCRLNRKREERRESERARRRSEIVWRTLRHPRPIPFQVSKTRLPIPKIGLQWDFECFIVNKDACNSIDLLAKDSNGYYCEHWVQDAWLGWLYCAKRYGILED